MRYSLSWRDFSTQRAWSDRTFGPGRRLKGILAHIRKELAEVEASGGDDIMEWVDIMVLAVDGATRAGHTGWELTDAYARKMAENYERDWPDWRGFSEDEPIEHVRVKPVSRCSITHSGPKCVGECQYVEGTYTEHVREHFRGHPAQHHHMVGGAVVAPEEHPGE